MTSVTASGWEIMMTCDPSISVILAPARWAIDLTTSLPAALSAVPTSGPGRQILPGRVPGLVAEGAGCDGPLGQAVDVGLQLRQVGGKDLAESGWVDDELGRGLRSFADRELLFQGCGQDDAVM